MRPKASGKAAAGEQAIQAWVTKIYNGNDMGLIATALRACKSAAKGIKRLLPNSP